MPKRLVLCGLVLASCLRSQSGYSGPKPEKKDVPYLVHGDNLVQTEAGAARQQDKKDEIVYTIAGENSPAKTPLASPIFVIDAAKIVPDKLQLFRLESKNGHREITFHKKGRNSDAIPLTVTKLGGNLYKLEVVNDIPNGEYSLTPEGENQVFCFSVF